MSDGARDDAGRPPIALTIAGSDSCGGAGIQADLKTFAINGVYGASVVTALTAQNTRGVQQVHVPPAAFVGAQITAVLEDLPVDAIKTGMLATADIVQTVAGAVRQRPEVPLVVDPVMVATSGDRLLQPDAISALVDGLIPHAWLLTPNRPEAAVLLDTAPAQSIGEAERQAWDLLRLGCAAVLLKGGHPAGAAAAEAVDVLVSAEGACAQFAAPWVTTNNTHGTGCTLSAAITAALARKEPLEQAVRVAKTYLTAALRAAQDQAIGRGCGPVDHLFPLKSG